MHSIVQRRQAVHAEKVMLAGRRWWGEREGHAMMFAHAKQRAARATVMCPIAVPVRKYRRTGYPG
jgi:hypothetical protein